MNDKQIEEDEQFLKGYEQAIREVQSQGASSSMPYSAAMYGGQQKQNLVEWQLDFKPELEDIERLLRCDVLSYDKDGNEIWIANPDQEAIVFNQRGVNDIIREIRMLLNKNKVLSNYGIEEIKPRVQMIGHELRAFIYNNYDFYGIDNEYKMNNYPIMVLTILDMIEASYRRALNGEERRDLNQARVVNQSEPMMPPNINVYAGMNQNKKGLISRAMPWNWGK